MVRFDLYMHGSTGFQPQQFSKQSAGHVVELDGIDGFFDQYFDGHKDGDLIQFASIGSLRDWPIDVRGLLALTFFTAEVVESRSISGLVRLTDISTLGEWSAALKLPAVPADRLEIPIRLPVNLKEFLNNARESGSAYWRMDGNQWHWQSLGEVTAIGASKDSDSVCLWILGTNAVPGYFARVSL